VGNRVHLQRQLVVCMDSRVILLTRRVKIVLSTLAAEVMTACRSDGFLGGLITDAADENILTTFAILLQDQVRMICNLSHLHNKTENVGVVVEQDTLCYVRLELAGTVVHDTASEVILFLSKELTINAYFLGWKK
jgi:hypothetical protein